MRIAQLINQYNVQDSKAQPRATTWFMFFTEIVVRIGGKMELYHKETFEDYYATNYIENAGKSGYIKARQCVKSCCAVF